MKIRLSTIKEDHSTEIALLEFLPCDLDVSNATPAQILEYRNRWQSVVLPNGENIEIKAEFGKGYSVTTIVVRQQNDSVFSLIANEIFASSFLTLSGLNVSMEIPTTEI